MKRRTRNHNLAPLNINMSEEERKLDIDIQNAVTGLKNMGIKDVENIFSNISTIKPKIIEIYYDNDCERVILIADGIKFYKSTGESRGTGLTNIWLPYERCGSDLIKGKFRNKVIKQEDKYLNDFYINKNKSRLIIDNLHSLLLYKRFINEENARISKWLYINKF